MPVCRLCLLSAVSAAMLLPTLAQSSSHREAPFIASMPRLDATDFYLFRSYETGRENYVTLIANYLPLQDAYGGPNYFKLDESAQYAIHIDNDGDAQADLSFSFRFSNQVRDLALGDVGGATVAVPLTNIGPLGPSPIDVANSNVLELFTVELRREDGSSELLSNLNNGDEAFIKPTDNIGGKSFSDYEGYANGHIAPVDIPGCAPGRVFVGQRLESFAVNLGEVFDLVNVSNPLGERDAEASDLADKNVTSLMLEVPIDCLTVEDPVIGGWTTASVPASWSFNPNPDGSGGMDTVSTTGDYVQVSRLGSPLVNEVVIGLPDKNRFNASQPVDDGQFATYVTNPTLPELLEILFFDAGVRAPNQFPRDDLIAAFLTGVAGLNQPLTVTPSEMLRLNTATPPTPMAGQDSLGVIGGDLAGFPNGRRPGDDVVDIALRVVMGVLLPEDVAPSGQLPFTDGAIQEANQFQSGFPYLNTPLGGSPNGTDQ